MVHRSIRPLPLLLLAGVALVTAGVLALLAPVALAAPLLQDLGPLRTGSGMSAENIAVVSAAVVTLTQLVKWWGLPDQRGPLVVVAFALLGVVLWGVSFEVAFTRALLWSYFASWIVVASTAAGVFGFTRAAVTAVTSARPPPAGGAGSNPTVP